MQGSDDRENQQNCKTSRSYRNKYVQLISIDTYTSFQSKGEKGAGEVIFFKYCSLQENNHVSLIICFLWVILRRRR